jgi:hypothetical protein
MSCGAVGETCCSHKKFLMPPIAAAACWRAPDAGASASGRLRIPAAPRPLVLLDRVFDAVAHLDLIVVISFPMGTVFAGRLFHATGELAPYSSETNVSVEGPDLAVMPNSAQALGMVFHELATNAVKYGALSTANGRVIVRWQAGSAQLSLVWQEEGGPTVATPKRRGFGSILIENVVRHELGGRLDLSLPPTGVRCEIDVPLARIAGKLD